MNTIYIFDIFLIVIGLLFVFKPEAYFKISTSAWRDLLGAKIIPSKRTYLMIKLGGVLAIVSGLIMLVGQII